MVLSSRLCVSKAPRDRSLVVRQAMTCVWFSGREKENELFVSIESSSNSFSYFLLHQLLLILILLSRLVDMLHASLRVHTTVIRIFFNSVVNMSLLCGVWPHVSFCGCGCSFLLHENTNTSPRTLLSHIIVSRLRTTVCAQFL